MVSPSFARTLLRLGGLAVLTISCWLYAATDESWWLFALLFFTPDLGMVGYLANPRLGAFVYNLLHTYTLAFLVIGGSFLFNQPLLWAAGLIWTAHVGFDRMLGYGLKYPSRFQDTHLKSLGGSTPKASAL